jgi:hypothetical protein
MRQRTLTGSWLVLVSGLLSCGRVAVNDDGATSTETSVDDGDPECSEASQCAVVNDCCNCTAAPVDMLPPCDAPECDGLTCDNTFGPSYVPAATCMIGTCMLAQISCNLDEITCGPPDPPLPPCVGNTLHSVIDSCFGPCVPPSMCASLPVECTADTCGEGFACVNTQSGAPSRCIPLPPACNGVGSCECVAPWWGEVCNGGCGGSDNLLLCEDGG